ncbi:PREDICTED: melanoma-associated antigen B2 [Rhinopithecus bieti]|uniref:melanoma-associated antigen B2 n=1 Tax=Rhinopithecus bieti TaxID=61621 RepID=UPI00083C25D6|nr:PREDICTED: melanoma-associated antigen B2 [Rhinopithecus bieti]
MPRGQKSKLRAREKRRKAREETQGLNAPQVTEAEEEEAPCCSSSVSGGAASSSPVAGIPQKPQRAPTTAAAAAAGVSSTKSKKGAKSQGEKNASSSQASTSTESSSEDPLSRKAGMLVQFLLYKCKIKESVTKGEMLKIVGKRFREHFPDILKKASERLNLVFGLELNKVKPNGHTYTFNNKVDLTDEECLLGTWDFPRNGLLMPLLGVIFLNGNSATEEEVWEFLNMLGVYDGEEHLVFGEPRKLITQDLVEEKYLEYKQVPNSDPPRYQFLWGPRAYAETSKMKVLEFLAKVNGTTPCAFPAHYEEALRDEGKAGV